MSKSQIQKVVLSLPWDTKLFVPLIIMHHIMLIFDTASLVDCQLWNMQHFTDGPFSKSRQIWPDFTLRSSVLGLYRTESRCLFHFLFSPFFFFFFTNLHEPAIKKIPRYIAIHSCWLILGQTEMAASWRCDALYVAIHQLCVLCLRGICYVLLTNIFLEIRFSLWMNGEY